MTWIYQDQEITELDPAYIGFVYIITQISSGKQYIGKKKAFFRKTSTKTVTLKNGEKRKKKIRSLVPSDWITYYGSSDALKAAIERCGESDFKREIIRLCKSESEMSYYEAREQFLTDCLLKPESYFNSWIMVRVRSDNLCRK